MFSFARQSENSRQKDILAFKGIPFAVSTVEIRPGLFELVEVLDGLEGALRAEQPLDFTPRSVGVTTGLLRTGIVSKECWSCWYGRSSGAQSVVISPRF